MKTILFLFITLFFIGCGTGPKIVVPSYTPPREVAKLQQIQTQDQFVSNDDAYMALWLNPEVIDAQKYNNSLLKMLIANVKEQLTQTNFIALDPIGDQNSVTLSMKVIHYNYKKQPHKASLSLEVEFTLLRKANEFLVKTHSANKLRIANESSLLPSEDALLQDAVKQVVRFFISDISPLKTNQLREFKPFPKQLQAVLIYIKQKNYKDAITQMLLYKGDKDKNFYYNLAIIYEALAASTEDIKMLRFAKLNYNKAISLGGYDDKLIIKTKARFDRFYNLFNKTKKQQKINQSLLKERDSLLGDSDDEYE